MTEERSAYRQIMKATSLFGGVQAFNIIISIIRSKFVAILLGPSGMGIIGLFYSTISLVSGITNFGLETSAVKDVSAANNSKNYRHISLVISVFRKLVWITGLFGTICIIVFSSLLSQITFGNRNYTIAFIWLSISLLFSQLTSGQLVILQGMRKLKQLAKANLIGNSIGLLITIPLYYLWGIDGIVPAIIGTSILTFIFSWIYARKIKIEHIETSANQVYTVGKDMLTMGFMISLGGLMSTFGSYLIRIFISQTGGVDQVGLFAAGFSIINMYMSLILKGMATDYYPRLSALVNDIENFKKTINKQTEIGMLIIAPLLIIFIIFINWVVILFYSKEFSVINTMIIFAALGMFFRVPGWALGFVFLARGESSHYFYLQLFAHVLLLGLSIAGYYFWGLTGTGIAVLIMYPLYLFAVYLINKKRIHFTFHKSTVNIFIFQFALATIALFAILKIEKPLNYIVGITTILFSSMHSLIQLDKRLELRVILKGYFSKK
jgi:O-antigen/teichoic acid export membrane protein